MFHNSLKNKISCTVHLLLHVIQALFVSNYYTSPVWVANPLIRHIPTCVIREAHCVQQGNKIDGKDKMDRQSEKLRFQRE